MSDSHNFPNHAYRNINQFECVGNPTRNKRGRYCITQIRANKSRKGPYYILPVPWNKLAFVIRATIRFIKHNSTSRATIKTASGRCIYDRNLLCFDVATYKYPGDTLLQRHHRADLIYQIVNICNASVLETVMISVNRWNIAYAQWTSSSALPL